MGRGEEAVTPDERAAEYAKRYDQFVRLRGIEEDSDDWSWSDRLAWLREVELMKTEGILIFSS